MIKNVLTHIGGIGIYGIVSICLFFTVFIGVMIWTTGLNKGYLNSMRRLPLDDADESEDDRATHSRDE